MTTRFSWGAQTDVGRVREINQDNVHAAEGLFVVADGMGGHRGGEVASAVAIEAMSTQAGESTTIEHLVERVHDANAAILDRASQDAELHGMGTTLCAVALLQGPDGGEPSRLGIINVGDSRVYRFADDQLTQVTQDHSLVETLVREGRISADEALNHPQRNILTRALGMGYELDVDYWELPIHLGDYYLLCSDGLFNEVTNDQIAATLRRLAEPSEIVTELVRMANEHGSRDNVTVVVARVDVGPDAPAAPITAPATAAAPITNEVPIAQPPAFPFATDEPGFADPVAPQPAAPPPAPVTTPAGTDPDRTPSVTAVVPDDPPAEIPHVPTHAAPPEGERPIDQRPTLETPPSGPPTGTAEADDVAGGPPGTRERPWWKFWGR